MALLFRLILLTPKFWAKNIVEDFVSANIEVNRWRLHFASCDDGQRPRSACRVSQHTSAGDHAEAAPWDAVKCAAMQVWVLLGPDSVVKERTGTASLPWRQAAPRFHNPRKKTVHQEEGPCAGIQPQSHDEGATQGCPFCTPQLPERVSSWKWVSVTLVVLQEKYHLEDLGARGG
jgi:hypothetical protein